MRKGLLLVFAFLSLIISLLTISAIETKASDSLLSPSYLIAVSEQDGCVPLHWFNQDSQPFELTYDDGTKDHQFYISSQWFRNKATVKMSSTSVPFALIKSRIFISYQGPESDTLYNPKTSFLISVNRDNEGYPEEIIWGPVSTNATGSDDSTEPGEWVEIDHNILIQEDPDFWIVFHWNHDSPDAPLIGEDSSPNSGRSFYYYLNDFGYFEWKKWPDYNLMIRSVIINHPSEETLNSGSGFKIYRSYERDFSLSMESLKDSVGKDQFNYIDNDVQNGQIYFYKITSIYEEEESEPSNEVEVTPKREASLIVEEDAIEVSLDTNQNRVEHLNLSNIGGIDLDFEIEISLSMEDSIRGTDHFGYIWTDSKKKPELEFEWIDLTSSGILLNQSKPPDLIYGPIPLEFSFPFYSNNYDSLWIMLNGCLKFSPVRLLKWTNDILPNTQTPLSLIAPFWSNLWFDDSTKIYYYSSPDSFIVSYIQMKHFILGKHLTFQTIFTRKGEIDFQYLKVENPQTSVTIGMQNEDGSCGLLISYNQEFTEDSLRVRIVPGWIQVKPRKDEIPPGDDLPLTFFFNSDFLDTGTYSGSLNINSQDKNHQLEPLGISLTFNVGAFQDTVSDTTGTDTSSAVREIEDERSIFFSLQQNYPNPFNTTTLIPFTVNGKQKTENGPIPITLKIYNIRGALVRTLVDDKRTSGEYEVIWDGKNEKGEAVASGIYFYKLKAGDFSETKKMILLR